MYVYIFAELMMLVFVIISRNASDKQCNFFLATSCAMWALIFGLRGYEVGNDTPSYTGFFELTNTDNGSYGTYEAPGESIEWGYVVLNRFLAFFSDSATFLFLVHGIFLFLMLFLIYRNNRNSVMSLLWMMTFGDTIAMMMVALRQSFSICFVLASLVLIEGAYQQCTEKKEIIHERAFWGGLICFIFAMTIHRTSVIFLPLLVMLYFLRVNKKIVYLFLTLAFVISLLFSDYISEIFDMSMLLVGGVEDDKINLLAERYGLEMENEGASIISKTALILPVYLATYFTDTEKINTLFFKCLVFGVILFLLFSSSTVITRIILLFVVLGYSVIIPPIVNEKWRIYVFYLLYTAYFMWRAFVHFAANMTSSKKSIGRIAAIDDTTQNILFELEDDTLIPASDDLIESIDINKQEINMNIPNGLLDI